MAGEATAGILPCRQKCTNNMPAPGESCAVAGAMRNRRSDGFYVKQRIVATRYKTYSPSQSEQ